MPDADHALIAIERMDLVDIDFDWPTKAIVAKAGFKRPAIEIERSEDGTLDIVKAFGGPAAPTVPNPKDQPATRRPPRRPLRRHPRPKPPSPREYSRRWTSRSARYISRRARSDSSTVAPSLISPRISRRWTCS